MAQLVKKIPGLGGLFFNKSGQLSIYLTNPANQRAKAAAIFSNFKPLTKTLARLRARGQKYRLASVSNINVKNSYQWQYASDLGGPWTTVASTQTYTRFVTQTDQTQRFSLRVNVTSGSEQASSTRLLTVIASGCPPNQICIQ